MKKVSLIVQDDNIESYEGHINYQLESLEKLGHRIINVSHSVATFHYDDRYNSESDFELGYTNRYSALIMYELPKKESL